MAVDQVGVPFGVPSDAQRIEEQAALIERSLLQVRLNEEEAPPPRRKNRLWGWRKRFG